MEIVENRIIQYPMTEFQTVDRLHVTRLFNSDWEMKLWTVKMQ